MHSYWLNCFDRSGWPVFRHTFEAEHNAETKLIADAICDACSDEHHRFELWKDDLPLAGGRTLGQQFQEGGLSPRARQTVRHALVALLNSDWRASHSRRLRGKMDAWALHAGKEIEDDAKPPRKPQDLPEMGGGSMRRLHRGIAYDAQSPDGVHWMWTAALKTADGKPLTGSLRGSKADAIRLCMEAIDEELRAAAIPATSRIATRRPWPIPAEAAPHRAPSGEAQTVLIAEDEALFRDAVALSLEECGFKVLHAADGREALAILKDHREIALLVSDIRMPGMDGYALAEAGMGLMPDLKVILMTGYAADPSQWVADRGIGTLHKPFDTNLLCRRAAELIAVS